MVKGNIGEQQGLAAEEGDRGSQERAGICRIPRHPRVALEGLRGELGGQGENLPPGWKLDKE